jgi:ppGpp synthetase/RelA/SpoT-type nucleotidyltranferase
MSDFEEDKHPRDEKGRFGSGGGGEGLKKFADKALREKVVSAYRKSAVAGASAKARGETHLRREDLGESVKSLKASIGTSLPKTHSVGEHIAIAKDFLAKHHANLDENVNALKKLSPANAEVKGRVKELASALGKVVRKPKYGTVDKLQDGAGMRVVAHSIEDVRKTVDNIKKNFKVVGEDNYIDHPQGSYRSHHLIIEGKDGMQREVQVRTANENRMADWSHNTYKPHTKEQRDAIKSAAHEIKDYEMKMADHFWAKDNGKKPQPAPPCPPAVKAHFGCLHD